MNEIQVAILKTIIYYDFFNYPLTLIEMYKYLNLSENGANLRQIKANLANLKQIEEKQGFYFLIGRNEIIETRKLNYRLSLRKLRKAKRVICLLSKIPYIKAIYIGSSLGYLNARDESDIDLLIITSRNRIWSARFVAAGILKIFNLRPKPNNTKDKFCLSYFITEDNLNLASTKINDEDIHLKYLLINYLPIYSENDLWEKFNYENKWLSKQFKNLYPNYLIDKFTIKPRCLRIKMFLNNIHLEKLVKHFQLKIMPKLLKEMMNKDNRVIINDAILKLHSNDKREEIYNKWKKQCQRIIS